MSYTNFYMKSIIRFFFSFLTYTSLYQYAYSLLFIFILQWKLSCCLLWQNTFQRAFIILIHMIMDGYALLCQYGITKPPHRLWNKQQKFGSRKWFNFGGLIMLIFISLGLCSMVPAWIINTVSNNSQYVLGKLREILINCLSNGLVGVIIILFTVTCRRVAEVRSFSSCSCKLQQKPSYTKELEGKEWRNHLLAHYANASCRGWANRREVRSFISVHLLENIFLIGCIYCHNSWPWLQILQNKSIWCWNFEQLAYL